jgi:ankyrin repeat protein
MSDWRADRPFYVRADYEGHTALHWAAELGLSDAVSWLLRQPDVDVDIEAYDNAHTPLHAAASHGHLLIVQMLYQKADKSKYVSYGGDGAVLSPAFLALMNEHYDVAMWLVRAEEKRLGKESDPQAVRQLKESLLHLAAMLDSVDVLRLLIEGAHGADVDARDSEGNTALHLAYQVGNDDTVAYLRDRAGCDAQAVNHRGLTPAQLQPGHGHDESEDDEEDEQSESEDNEVGEESEEECESDVEQGLPDEAQENAEQAVQEECYLENLPQEIILRVRRPATVTRTRTRTRTQY